MSLLPHLLFVLLVAAGGWLVYTHSFFESLLSRKQALAFYLLKVAAATLLTWYYMNHTADLMKADVFKYFYDANVLHQLLFTKPLIWMKIFLGVGTTAPEVFTELNKTEFYFSAGNHWISDDRLMLKFQMLVRLFSCGNIYIHSLVFAAASFVVAFWFWKKVQHRYQLLVPESAVAVMALPSTLFWCSAAVKDTLLLLLLFLAVGSLIAITNEPSNRSSKKQWLILLVAVIGMFLIRPFVPLFLIGALMVVLAVMSTKRLHNIFGWTLLLAAVAVFFLSDTIAGLLLNKRNELVEISLRESSRSLSDGAYYSPTRESLWQLLPAALRDAVVLPTPLSSLGWTARLFGIELWALLLLLVFTFARRRQLALNKKVFVFTSLLFAAGLFIVIGFTTPVIGTAVRYRAIALPGIAISIVLLLRLNNYISISKLRSVLKNTPN